MAFSKPSNFQKHIKRIDYTSACVSKRSNTHAGIRFLGVWTLGRRRRRDGRTKDGRTKDGRTKDAGKKDSRTKDARTANSG